MFKEMGSMFCNISKVTSSEVRQVSMVNQWAGQLLTTSLLKVIFHTCASIEHSHHFIKSHTGVLQVRLHLQCYHASLLAGTIMDYKISSVSHQTLMSSLAQIQMIQLSKMRLLLSKQSQRVSLGSSFKKMRMYFNQNHHRSKRTHFSQELRTIYFLRSIIRHF